MDAAQSELQPAPQTPAASANPKYARINWPVLYTSGVLIIAFVVWAAVWPQQAKTVIFGSMDWIATNLGWYYIFTAGIIVLFVLVVAFSKVGNTRMGPDHSRPKYPLFTWAAMLFAAGIGVDLMFFSVAGPATNLLTPPDLTPLSEEAARMAPIWTMFHYGIPGWAMYALMGIALGLASYRYHTPLSIRSAITPLLGTKTKIAGNIVDTTATLGTVFGIATSLGIGVVFLNYGLTELWGIPNNLRVWFALIIVSVVITILSTMSGVDKGIRRLSEINVILAIGLLGYILIVGKTATLLNQLVQNIGDFISRFPGMMLNTFAYTPGPIEYSSSQWLQDWTLFFWAWWIAWTPFVGLFLTRISRGRTLREFILGVMLIPFGFILVFISIFANSANGIFAHNPELLRKAVDLPESGFFNMLTNYPGATFLIALAVIVGLLFYVTSADSGSLVMANMTSHASLHDSGGAPGLRIFWAVVTGALTLAMLLIDGIYTLQAATVLIGLPFSIIMYLLIASVSKILRLEGHARASHARASRAMPSVLGQTTWRQRLAHDLSFPPKELACEFIESTAAEAVEEVALELKRLGTNTSYRRGSTADTQLPYVNLVVVFPGQEDFKYQLMPVARPLPRFANTTDQSEYYCVEVFTARGTRGQNLMGCTKEQIIADVLDSYEQHMAYVARLGDSRPVFPDAGSDVPTTWQENT